MTDVDVRVDVPLVRGASVDTKARTGALANAEHEGIERRMRRNAEGWGSSPELEPPTTFREAADSISLITPNFDTEDLLRAERELAEGPLPHLQSDSFD